VVLQIALLAGAAPGQSRPAGGWEQVFRPGKGDGAVGGTEILHLVAHKGRLFAGNGYWMDPRGPANTPWAQVLVLDSPGGAWKVDLAMGAGHLRATALKSVTFATDAAGKPLDPPVNLLLAASDIQTGPKATHIWTRDDDRGTWVRTTLPASEALRRSTRAFAVHRDRVTHVDRVFVAAGAPGIFSGAYDPALPGKIRWDQQPELGPLAIRPMYFAAADGHLYASAGTSVYRRRDGAGPSWEKVYSDDDTPEHWELGGIRGLTPIPSPARTGESLLLSHTDRIIRIDCAQGHHATLELRIGPLLEKHWGTSVAGGVIAAYNDMLPLRDPATGRTVHVFGVQGRIRRVRRGQSDAATQGGWRPAGTYLIREAGGAYRLGEVDGPWQPGKPMLVAPRALAVSPFPADAGRVVYVGGFDCNFFPARDSAWVFRAPVETVLANGEQTAR